VDSGLQLLIAMTNSCPSLESSLRFTARVLAWENSICFFWCHWRNFDIWCCYT